MTPKQFIAAIAPSAVAFMHAHEISAAFIIAQGALESGWGSTAQAMGNNIFGIKADPSWHGPTITTETREFINGKWEVVNAKFRAYPSMQACVDDHEGLLLSPRYQNLVGVDYKAACHLIAAVDHYATDPNYESKLLGIIQQHQLDQYDKTEKGNSDMTNPTLQRGASGTAVRTLQRLLNAHGAKLLVDGIFGPATQAAVVDFQKAQHAKDPKFVVDGIVGPQTWAELTAPIANNPSPPVSQPAPTPASPAYDLKCGWTAPEYTIGTTGDFWVQTLKDGKPIATDFNIGSKSTCPFVHVSDGEDGPVPTFLPDGRGGVPWSTSNPGKYTITARWATPDGKTIYATADTTWVSASSSNPPPSQPSPAGSHPIVAAIPLTIEGDAFFFNLPLDGGKEVSPIQLDTGAFAIMLDTQTATALGLKNDGSLTVGGIGGQVTAWSSSLPVKFGDKVYDMYCVVDPQWDMTQMGSHGLFGMRDVISHGLGLDVNTVSSELEIYNARS